MSEPETLVLLPVKPPAVGKSRLTHVPPGVRRELARAFALDTLAAVLATPGVDRVLVLTGDRELAGTAAAWGVGVAPDPVPGDLNATLSAAASGVAPGTLVVALCADLPALRPGDLAAALGGFRALRGSPAFVADADGTGTTTYAATPVRFAPRFGRGSAAAHGADGAVGLTEPLESLRADVDDRAGLERARALGVGPHTAAVLAEPPG